MNKNSKKILKKKLNIENDSMSDSPAKNQFGSVSREKAMEKIKEKIFIEPQDVIKEENEEEIIDENVKKIIKNDPMLVSPKKEEKQTKKKKVKKVKKDVNKGEENKKEKTDNMADDENENKKKETQKKVKKVKKDVNKGEENKKEKTDDMTDDENENKKKETQEQSDTKQEEQFRTFLFKNKRKLQKKSEILEEDNNYSQHDKQKQNSNNIKANDSEQIKTKGKFLTISNIKNNIKLLNRPKKNQTTISKESINRTKQKQKG